jgi:hypothetical protein
MLRKFEMLSWTTFMVLTSPLASILSASATKSQGLLELALHDQIAVVRTGARSCCIAGAPAMNASALVHDSGAR